MSTNLDPNSPYYLHPSDNPEAILVSCSFTGGNYFTWQHAMCIALRAKNKYGFVDGSLQRPSPSMVEEQAWIKVNSMVIAWIFNSLVHELHESFGDLPIASYFTKLKGLWDELGNLSPIPNCECRSNYSAIKEMMVDREKDRLHQFLMGLNDVFNNVKSTILAIEPLPTINRAYPLIVQDEKHQVLMTQRAMYLPNVVALIASRSGDRNSNPRTKVWCKHCKRQGHSKDRCYELIGYPDGWEKRKPNRGTKTKVDSAGGSQVVAAATSGPTQATPTSFTLEQYNQLLCLMNMDMQSLCASNMSSKGFSTTVGPSDWILDSGAYDHMTPMKYLFLHHETMPFPLSINLLDGSVLFATHKGTVMIIPRLLIHDVLYVPGFDTTCFP
ncbi:PREDICTED: uncharacterized protein LOC104607332 [Nelumbo nucifera]|uniref:Uncharacterized protein LOC104607332 n=1 Tax=Nelumbo nucifera TaxID=4432 RepID=A0A1U8B5X3_NELNU|nr:PREDICTED: uncharacterized protein LOC104607332 [Nelumbo nucifera]